VDEIIAKNIAAHGGLEKIKAVQSVRMTGRIILGQGIEAPITLELKRPMRMRMEFTFQGLTGVRAYDGKTGWQLMPFMGKRDPEPLPPEELKEAEEQADLEGPLVEYKTKGHQVELIGKEKVEGTDCYKLKVTLKNGDIVNLYLDTDSLLEIKLDGKRVLRGNEVEFESSFGDYKEVGGLMLPHAFEGGLKGSPQRQKIVFDKVELNAAVDDARFQMPEVKPAEQKPAEPKPPAGLRRLF
jgi:outer membrane lipoprotein-sorting protein